MSIWTIAWRSILQRGLASTLTAISMALGITLVIAVLVIESRVDRSFNNQTLGYDVIVGAKGGQLQLVLNTVFHLSQPVENIPYWYYKEFLPKSQRSDGQAGRFSDYVERAVPICMGDYFHEFRVVATTPDYFTAFDEGPKYEFAEGAVFKSDQPFTGVIGAEVARRTGLKVGGKFAPSHGVASGGHVHDPFTIVGVLKRMGTPADRAVFANMEGFYMIGDHALPEYLQRKNIGQLLAPGADHDHADHDKAPATDHDHDHGATPAATKPSDAKPDATPAPADKPAAAAEQQHASDRKHATDDDSPAAAGDASAPDQTPAHNLPAHTEPAKAESSKTDSAKLPAHTAADHDHDAVDHDHDEHAGHHHHAPLTEEQREVTAILIRTRGFGGAMGMQKFINKDSIAQMAYPIGEIGTFFETFVRPFQYLLLGLSVLIIVVSGIGIMVSIYNSMSDRRHEIAVMRALGASRGTVMWIILLESILLSLGGVLLGWLLGQALIAVLSPWILNSTGVSVGFFGNIGLSYYHVPVEVYLIVGIVALASLVGLLPAFTAYRTDVARALSASP